MTNTPNGNGRLGHAVLNLNRTVGTALLGILVWLALQVWDDVKAMRTDVSTLSGQMSNHTWRLDTLDRRVDRLETVRRSGQ